MADQRRYERVPFFCDVSVTALPDGPTIHAHSFDISLGGVGLVTECCMESGRMVALAFSFLDDSGKTVVGQVHGKVARCDAESDGNCVGIEFLEPLSESRSPQLVRKLLKI